MGINIFDKILGALHLNFMFRGGDRRISNQQAGGNITNIMMVSNNPAAQDTIVQKAQTLIADKANVTNQKLSVALGTFIGVVKSVEKPGTRVHLEFAVINNADTPTVIQGAYLQLNDGVAHFKMFFKPNANGLAREPDMSEEFPIIINSRGATKMRIEFENIKLALINPGKNEGEIFVLTEDNKLSSKKFTLQVDEVMVEVLKQSQESADNTGVPSILQVSIQV